MDLMQIGGSSALPIWGWRKAAGRPRAERQARWRHGLTACTARDAREGTRLLAGDVSAGDPWLPRSPRTSAAPTGSFAKAGTAQGAEPPQEAPVQPRRLNGTHIWGAQGFPSGFYQGWWSVVGICDLFLPGSPCSVSITTMP